jgi:hypothetical protein
LIFPKSICNLDGVHRIKLNPEKSCNPRLKFKGR